MERSSHGSFEMSILCLSGGTGARMLMVSPVFLIIEEKEENKFGGKDKGRNHWCGWENGA